MNSAFYTNHSSISFLKRIQDSFDTCAAFYLSVSFIKIAGLKLIEENMERALKRGAKGRLITSTYQNFTDISSLNYFYKLAEKYPSFACHLDRDCFHDSGYQTVGFHTKGYLFEYKDHLEVIVGSSNITRFALLKNQEWDLSVSGKENQTYIEVKNEFRYLWDNTLPLSKDVIQEYAQHLEYAVTRWDMDYELLNGEIRPNYMQRRALRELIRYRAGGVGKALIIAAAGSGKTYLAAFDALNMAPKKLLYIVEEGTILEKAYETFWKVFGNEKEFGFYNKDHKDVFADFLFSTNVTMAKAVDRHEFKEDEFDYIVVDECHHATASTYRKIINYFKPEFLLGLTATPERMDNEDVFSLFDENVPYELRLRDAIINDLVVPFHYYGIRDVMTRYDLSDRDERRFINEMIDPAHIDFIHTEIEKHRVPGKLKAIVFCRSISQSVTMANALSTYYHTAYLTGRNSTGERIKAFQDLQDDTKDLEVLCTVDILNEGADIPGINMVLFLRPTESSTIFIQQLGRGLRKFPGKDYVTVLDFIGNSYKRSTQIAFALGSLSENFVVEKRLLQSMVETDFKSLGLDRYGVEIHIDALSKEEVLKYISAENFNQKKYLKQDYENFKSYIGSQYYPSHMDYLNSDVAPDLVRFMQVHLGRKTGSYYGFLKEIGEKNLPQFDETQEKFVTFLSGFLPLVRPYEYLIYQKLFASNGQCDLNSLYQYVQENTESYFDERIYDHALQYIGAEYVSIEEDKVLLNPKLHLSDSLLTYVNDLLDYGLARYEADFPKHESFFVPWKNYSTEQIQRIRLINPGYSQLGTYYDEKQKAVYSLVTLKKKDITEDTKQLDYDDQYLSNTLFQWESRNNLSEKEKNQLFTYETVYLFIRKVKNSGGITLPYTFVGKGHFTGYRPSPTKKKCYIFTIEMDQPLPEDLALDFGVPETPEGAQS
jgi:superfamily II DNA or RNA helicase